MKINGQTIQTPTNCELGRFTLSKSGRAASGRMRTDVIAVKRRLDCSWTLISAPALKQIHDILESAAEYLVEFVDTRSGEVATMTAYSGDRKNTLWHTIGGVRYWKDASIALIEV